MGSRSARHYEFEGDRMYSRFGHPLPGGIWLWVNTCQLHRLDAGVERLASGRYEIISRGCERFDGRKTPVPGPPVGVSSLCHSHIGIAPNFWKRELFCRFQANELLCGFNVEISLVYGWFAVLQHLARIAANFVLLLGDSIHAFHLPAKI